MSARRAQIRLVEHRATLTPRHVMHLEQVVLYDRLFQRLARAQRAGRIELALGVDL